MKIRIYYESVEQLCHFFESGLERGTDSIGKSIETKRISFGNGGAYGRNLAPIFSWKDPDLLVTTLVEGVEYPLLLVEFSMSSYTEDHEMQRFDGQITAARGDCTFLKISSTKKESPSDHGGNTGFDHAKTYAEIHDQFGHYQYHVEWPLKDEESTILKMMDRWPSCPPHTETFIQFMRTFVVALESASWDTDFDWPTHFDDVAREHGFAEWHEAVDKADRDDPREYDTSRRWWDPDERRLHHKIARLARNFDPDGGMIPYHRLLSDTLVTHFKFSADSGTFNNLATEEELYRRFEEGEVTTPADYADSLADAISFEEDFREHVDLSGNSADLSEFLNGQFDDLPSCWRLLFLYSEEHRLLDGHRNEVFTFTWDSFDRDPFASFQTHSDGRAASPLRTRKGVSEDFVTYASLEVYRENGFTPIATSYPGAQSDKPILPDFEKGGRGQRRTYPDAVAVGDDSSLCLQESKGYEPPSVMEKEIQKLHRFRTDDDYIEALKEYINHYGLDTSLDDLRLGYAFWDKMGKGTPKERGVKNYEQLDYCIWINHSETKWLIEVYSDDLGFDQREGPLNLPETFEVVGHSDQNLSLDTF